MLIRYIQYNAVCTVCYILKRSVVCLLSTLYHVYSGDHAPLEYIAVHSIVLYIYHVYLSNWSTAHRRHFPILSSFFNFDCVGVIFATLCSVFLCFSLRLLPARPPPTSIIITALVSSPLYCYTVLYWQCTYLISTTYSTYFPPSTFLLLNKQQLDRPCWS